MTQQHEAARMRRGNVPMRSKGRGGARLRAERIERDLDQKAVARAFYDGEGIPSYMLSGFEREECRLPRGFMADYRRALDRVEQTAEIRHAS